MWIKLDDGFATHPKILAAGPWATVLQIRAICYASQNKTDGFLPAAVIPMLTHGLDVSCTATHMVSSGLWKCTPTGYVIHDYLVWNMSKAQLDVIIEKLSRAGKKGMKSRWKKKNSHDNLPRNQGYNTPNNLPITPPITQQSTSTSTSVSLSSPDSLASLSALSAPDLRSKSHTDEFEQFWLAYPKKIGKKAARVAWRNASDRPGLPAMLEAIGMARRSEQWMKDNGQFIPHPATWLNQGRWADQPLLKNPTTMDAFLSRHPHREIPS